MLNIEDIRIGKTYYVVQVYGPNCFQAEKITPTEVFMDIERRGENIICVKYKENKNMITWFSKRWTLNEFEPDFKEPIMYIFDDKKLVIKCLEQCKDAKIEQLQNEIREREEKIVEICKQHTGLIIDLL